MGSVRTIDSDLPDLFEMSTERFIHFLRTKTSIGNLYEAVHFPLFDAPRAGEVDVELNDDSSNLVDVPFGNRAMMEILKKTSPGSPRLLSADEANKKIASNDNIGGNAIYDIGVSMSASGCPMYYNAFAATRDWYPEVSLALGLCDDPSGDLKTLGSYDVKPCIELAARGQPTAVEVNAPQTGALGYWYNQHIIILDNRLKLDEGRKTPVGGRYRMYQTCARSVLFDRIKSNTLSAALKDPVVALNTSLIAKGKERIIENRLKGKSPLGFPKVKMANEPNHEQDVLGLFHELIGAGVLNHYVCLDCSSYSKYDAIFSYEIPMDKTGSMVQGYRGQFEDHIDEDNVYRENLILEYKHRGEEIIPEILMHVKFYYAMDILVCWEIDEEACAKAGATLRKKPLTHVLYYGTTHELSLSPVHFGNMGNGRPLEVIALKDLLMGLRDGTYRVP